MKLDKAVAPLAEWLDSKFGWPRLPYPLGLATLVGLRARLRERNLYGTFVPEANSPLFLARSATATYGTI